MSDDPAVVPLERSGESAGRAWLRAGAWLFLLPPVLLQLGNVYFLWQVESAGDGEWMMSSLSIANIVGRVAMLVGVMCLALGAVQAVHAGGDRVAGWVFRVAGAAAALVALHEALSIYVYIKIQVDPFRLDIAPDSTVFKAFLWLWHARLAALPVLIGALLFALTRKRSSGRAIAGAAVVAAAAQSAVFLLAALDLDPWMDERWVSLAVHLGLYLVVLIGALVAIGRPGERREAEFAGALLPDPPAWLRAASGLEIFAGAVLVRVWLAFALPLGLLATTATFAVTPLIVALVVAAVGSAGSAIGMAVGANRLRAAPEPVSTRAFTGAAALFFAVGALLDGYAFLTVVRLLEDQRGDTRVLEEIGLVAPLLSLLAYLPLLGAMASIGRWLGDRDMRGAAARLAALFIVVIGGVTFVNGRFIGAFWSEWQTSPFLPLVAAAAFLAALLPLRRMARRLATGIRVAVTDGPPLARAVARARRRGLMED